MQKSINTGANTSNSKRSSSFSETAFNQFSQHQSSQLQEQELDQLKYLQEKLEVAQQEKLFYFKLCEEIQEKNRHLQEENFNLKYWGQQSQKQDFGNLQTQSLKNSLVKGDLSNTKKDLQESIKMVEENKRLTSENQGLTQTLEKMRLDNLALMQQIQNFQKPELQQQYQDNPLVQVLQTQNQLLRNQLQNQKLRSTERESHSDQFEGLKRQISELQNEKEQMRNRSSQMKQKLEQEIRELSKASEELQEKVNNFELKLTPSQSTIKLVEYDSKSQYNTKLHQQLKQFDQFGDQKEDMFEIQYLQSQLQEQRQLMEQVDQNSKSQYNAKLYQQLKQFDQFGDQKEDMFEIQYLQSQLQEQRQLMEQVDQKYQENIKSKDELIENLQTQLFQQRYPNSVIQNISCQKSTTSSVQPDLIKDLQYQLQVERVKNEIFLKQQDEICTQLTLRYESLLLKYKEENLTLSLKVKSMEQQQQMQNLERKETEVLYAEDDQLINSYQKGEELNISPINRLENEFLEVNLQRQQLQRQCEELKELRSTEKSHSEEQIQKLHQKTDSLKAKNKELRVQLQNFSKNEEEFSKLNQILNSMQERYKTIKNANVQDYSETQPE